MIKTLQNNNSTVLIVVYVDKEEERTFSTARNANVAFQMLSRININVLRMPQDQNVPFAFRNNSTLLNKVYSFNVVIPCISNALKTQLSISINVLSALKVSVICGSMIGNLIQRLRTLQCLMSSKIRELKFYVMTALKNVKLTSMYQELNANSATAIIPDCSDYDFVIQSQ